MFSVQFIMTANEGIMDQGFLFAVGQPLPVFQVHQASVSIKGISAQLSLYSMFVLFLLTPNTNFNILLWILFLNGTQFIKFRYITLQKQEIFIYKWAPYFRCVYQYWLYKCIRQSQGYFNIGTTCMCAYSLLQIEHCFQAQVLDPFLKEPLQLITRPRQQYACDLSR